MTALELAAAIRGLKNPTQEDIDALRRAVKYLGDCFLDSNGAKLGDTVTFDAKTRGIKKGIVIKLNEKTAKVVVTEGDRRITWNVSRPLLRKV